MDAPLLHLLIIWSKGLSQKDFIIDDLKQHFEVLNIFDCSWENSLFKENLKRFYAHSQRQLPPTEFDALMEYKIDHCGDGSFIAIVFEDRTPNYQNLQTTDGVNRVNANVFNKKKEYRQLLGGGHKIHASDNFYETNKDLSLLLECSALEYKKEFSFSEKVIARSENIVGVPQWRDINQLFFVLNNTLEYVVLRNFDCLPDNYHVEGHGDIDMMVEDLNFMRYVSGARSVFKEPYRVYHKITINDEEVPFDFRFLGDDYYDKKWQIEILNKRVKTSNGFFIPDPSNHFYSLLYHAYVQKRSVAQDYKVGLENLAEVIGVSYKTSSTASEVQELLSNYMSQKRYKFVLPIDITVYFDKDYLENQGFENNEDLGELVASSLARSQDQVFFSEVYKRKGVYTKVATNPIAQNEYRYLTQLDKYPYFPQAISEKLVGDYTQVEISEVVGFTLSNIKNPYKFWRKKNIIRFVKDSIDILIVLLEHEISHRDIRSQNIIVAQDGVWVVPKLIDFGWAEKRNDNRQSILPINLGLDYKWPGEGFSDAYSMGKTLSFYFKKFKFYSAVLRPLLSISPEEYHDKELLLSKLKALQEDSLFVFSFKNRLEMYAKRFGLLKFMGQLLGKRTMKKIKNRIK